MAPPNRKHASTAIGRRLQEVATSVGGVNALARKAGITTDTIQDWLYRGVVPKGDILLRLHKICRASPTFVLVGKGPMTTDVSTKPADFVHELRAQLMSRLTENQPDAYRRFVERTLPRGAVLLEEIAAQYHRALGRMFRMLADELEGLEGVAYEIDEMAKKLPRGSPVANALPLVAFNLRRAALHTTRPRALARHKAKRKARARKAGR